MRKIKSILTIVLAVFMLTACNNSNEGEADTNVGEVITAGIVEDLTETSTEETTTEDIISEEIASEEVTSESIQEDVTLSNTVSNQRIEHMQYVEDIKVIQTTDQLILEKDGIGYEVDWPYVVRGTGEGTSGQLVDVNGDGEEELIYFPHIRETQPVFIYDFANEKDLSPYFCLGSSIWTGVFWYPEYASEIVNALNECMEPDGYGSLRLLEDGTLNSGYYTIRYTYGEDSILNENGGISLSFYFFSLFAREWWCDMELTFDEEGCHMEIIEASNRYRAYQGVIDTVTEHSMPGIIEYDSDEREYNFRFEKDNVVVSFLTDLNHANANISITYDGKECEQDWMFLSTYSECYFELYDYDSDGVDELIYHAIGKDGEEVWGYDFEWMSEIYITGDGTEQLVVPEMPSNIQEELFIDEAKNRDFEYRYNEQINSWDEVFVVEDVKLVHQPKTEKIYIEYDNKSVELEWALGNPENGKNMSFEMSDATGDGVDDFILFTNYLSSNVVFVYDMANEVDVSPYYGITDNLQDGLYLYEEYAVPVVRALNERFEVEGYGRLHLTENGSLNIISNCTYIGNDISFIFQYGSLALEYYEDARGDREWNCLMRFSLKDGECNMYDTDISTRYSRFQIMLETKTDYTLDGTMEYIIEDTLGIYKFSFKKDDTTITFEINKNSANVVINVISNGVPIETGWRAQTYGLKNIYFELYDKDGDGKQELIYHLIETDGETIQVYDL